MAAQSRLGMPLRLLAAATVAAVVACDRERPPSRVVYFKAMLDTLAGADKPAPPVPKRLSEAGLAMIREHEAFVGKEYDDGAGNSTIGYGHMVLEGEDFSGGITEAKAIELFEKDVERVVNGALDKIKVELTQNQIDALGSFIFNVGPGAFQRGLLPHINARRHEQATRRLLTYITGRDARTGERRVLRGLLKRRRAEVALYNDPRPFPNLRRALRRATG